MNQPSKEAGKKSIQGKTERIEKENSLIIGR
jgi:hypothetical protein